MKIGITCYPAYGGSGIAASEIGMELAARGHEVHFITYANPIRLPAGCPGVFYKDAQRNRADEALAQPVHIRRNEQIRAVQQPGNRAGESFASPIAVPRAIGMEESTVEITAVQFLGLDTAEAPHFFPKNRFR